MRRRDSRQNTSAAQRHLDQAGSNYLHAINGVNVDNLSRYVKELSRLTERLSDIENPRVLSVGVGSGIEIHALKQSFPNGEIFGVDLSKSPLLSSQVHSHKFGLEAKFIQGSATELPLKTDSMDGIVLSAILHEIYSYVPDGVLALKTALSESLRVTRDGGFIYIKDFATVPQPKHNVKMVLKSDLSKKFYRYFQKHYRRFESWPESSSDSMLSTMNAVPEFPYMDDSFSVFLPAGWVSEFVMHMRNALNDYMKDMFFFDESRDISWKEINEQYHPSLEDVPMSPSDYFEFINDISQDRRLSKRIILEEMKIDRRVENRDALSSHVAIFDKNGAQSYDIADLTAKMTLIIQVKKRHKSWFQRT